MGTEFKELSGAFSVWMNRTWGFCFIETNRRTWPRCELYATGLETNEEAIERLISCYRECDLYPFISAVELVADKARFLQALASMN